MTEVFDDSRGRKHAFVQRWQDVVAINLNEVVEPERYRRRRRSRPGHQSARLESFKCLDVLFEILDVVRVCVNVAALEQRMPRGKGS
jgi:hypothetical protein